GEVAARTGMSRVSARRYLEHLVATGRADVAPRYGAAGRPENGYRPA
ncbi:two-component system response regulator, partial [Cellulosimicrobium funkei]